MRKMSEQYKETWAKVMKDLIYATHCHTCGEMPRSDAYSGIEFCCKRPCWKVYMITGNCFFGGPDEGCHYCLMGDEFSPSLKNSLRMQDYYRLNPMGSGTKFSLYK